MECEEDGTVSETVYNPNNHCCIELCVEAHEEDHLDNPDLLEICQGFKECIEDGPPADEDWFPFRWYRECKNRYMEECYAIQKDIECPAMDITWEVCEDMKGYCSDDCDCREGTDGYEAIEKILTDDPYECK